MFWMQIGVYLNIYATPFVMALLKPPLKSGGAARLTERVRNWAENVARWLNALKVSSLPILHTHTTLHTLHPYTHCMRTFSASYASISTPNSQGKCGDTTMWRQTAKEPKWEEDHTRVIAVVITFIIIIIRVRGEERRGEEKRASASHDHDTTRKEWKQKDLSSQSDTKSPWNVPCEVISPGFKSPPVPLSFEPNPLRRAR